MKIAVLGTGMVGEAIATKLVELGHDVKMGSRSATNEKAVAWAKARQTATMKATAAAATFADAAAGAEVVFNCTSGVASLAALEAAGAANLAGKVLIDVANPLDFSRGMPPTLSVCNTDSLGEQIQRAFPAAKVVKAFNTVNANVMVSPGLIKGEHDLFICGNDAGAKGAVTELAKGFGWKSVIDLGDITGARASEMLVVMWVRLYGVLGSPMHTFRVVR